MQILGRRSEAVAVADIGSASAGFAILQLRGDLPATVLTAERSIAPMEERSEDAAIAAIGEQLSRAATNVLKVFGEKAKQTGPLRALYVIIRAPWTRSKTAIAQSVLKEETRVDEERIASLAKDVLANAADFDRSKSFEANVVRVELNGYPTSKPEGKYAHEIAVTAIMSECNAALRAIVESTLEKLLPHVKPTLRSGARTLLSVLHEHITGDYLIVDMSGESTAMIAVRDDAPAEQVLVPEGIRTILKRVAPNGMPEETLSLIRMVSMDQCETSACQAMLAAIGSAEPELARIFGEALAASSASSRLPNRLILVTQADLAGWLSRFFARIDFAQFTETTQPFSVESLSPNDLSRWVVPNPGVVLDTGLAAMCALVNIEARSH